MNIRHTPDTVAKPFGPYSHAVEVPEGSRLLYISGEVGVLPDGTVPQGIEAQAEACWLMLSTGNHVAVTHTHLSAGAAMVQPFFSCAASHSIEPG